MNGCSIGQLRLDDVRIGLVSDDHIFAVDEAVRPCRITWTGGGHRRQFQNIFFAHGRLVSF
jgi:hypothetical protein